MRRNPLIVLLALSALLLSTTGSALAQTDEYAAEAEGLGYALLIMGEDGAFGGDTEVDITSDPFAEALGLGTNLSDSSASSASVEGEGSDTDEGCAEELAVFGPLISSCSTATASIAEGLPYALATADGLEINVGGDVVVELVEVLTDLVIENLAGPLDDGLDEVQEQLIAEVADALFEACTQVLEPIAEEAPISDILDALPIDDIVDASPEELQGVLEALIEAGEELDEACALFLQIMTNPPVIGDGIEELLDDIRELVAQILTDTNLINIALAGSESEAEASVDLVEAVASAQAASIEVAGLSVLTDIIEQLEDAIGDFLAELEGFLIEDVAAAVGELPGVTEILDTILAEFPEELSGLLDSDAPLIAVGLAGSSAAATFDRDTGEVSAEGSIGALTVSVLPALADIFDQESTVTLDQEGDSVTILEGTPLESRFAIGHVNVASDERDGMSGERATAEGLAISLIAIDADGDDDGFEPPFDLPIGGDDNGDETGPVLLLEVASTTAAAYGGVVDEPEALPVTGGSAVPIALLLLAAGLLFARRLRMPAGEHDQG